MLDMLLFRLLRRYWHIFLVFNLWAAMAGSVLSTPPSPLRRINAPYLPGGIYLRHTAVAWLGRISPDDNYADIRVGYDDREIFVRVTALDRRLWYDTSPVPSDLSAWDSVSLYIDRGGNVGMAPDDLAYRFDAQLNWWEPRLSWQTSFRGDGSQWVSAALAFTSASSFAWESDTVGGLNADQDNRGWLVEYRLPFSSFGLSGPPPQGAIWGFGVALHDRDSAAGPPRADQLWPPALSGVQPATWGQLHFGLPTYTPLQAAAPRGQTTIRHGLNGATVADGTVGGHTNCGDGPNYWTEWPNWNYAHVTFFNVQNQDKIADWPCFSKFYMTFPLNDVPVGKVIISATVTLRQFGNAGQGWVPGPQPSFIQALGINDEWSESTLTWNNAPLARENLAVTQVDPLLNPGYPGVPRSWDISQAVANAYAAGEPVRLAFYSADSDMHSGRYFYSSDTSDPQTRPTLVVTWGDPVSTIDTAVWPVAVKQSQQVTYTLSLLGSGRALTLTDDLPAEVSDPGLISVNGGDSAAYDIVARRVTWSGVVASGQALKLTFPVTVVASVPVAIVNTAVLTDAISGVSHGSAVILANPYSTLLPVIRK
jgi:hypothetical protein